MDLATLNFAVNTSQLKDAITLVKELGVAVDGLKKPLANVPDLPGSKPEDTSAPKKAGESVDGLTKKIEKQSNTLKIMRNQAVEASDGLVHLADTLTRAQASSLAMMKVSGATTEQLTLMSNQFELMNRLLGVNPFDQSAAGLGKLKKELSEVRLQNELATKGIKLTVNEVRELSRELTGMSDKMIVEGASTDAIRTAIGLRREEYIETAKLLNIEREISKENEKQARQQAQIAAGVEAQVRKSEKELQRVNAQNKYMEQGYGVGTSSVAAGMEVRGVPPEVIKSYLDRRKALEDSKKAAREYGNAVEYVTALEARLATALDKTNAGLREDHTAEIARMTAAVKRMGLSADETDAKVKRLTADIRAMAAKENERNVGNLARAMSVQLGDVGISLASGQNPFIVMIQQGDQIRDAIARSGVEAAAMAGVMKQSIMTIVDSFKMMAGAIGSFMGQAVSAMGTGLVQMGLNIAGSNLKVKDLLETLDKADATFGKFNAKSIALRLAIGALGTGVALAGVSFLALTVAFFKVQREQDAMVKSLYLTGGALAANKEAALTYAANLEAVGVSTSKAVEVITEMAKVGGFVSSEIEAVATSAKELELVAGVAIADTVKKFAELKKDPVDALAKLARETGNVRIEVLNQVLAMKEQGKTTEAVKVAMQEMARVNGESAKRIREDLTGLGKVLLDMKEGASSLWQSLKGLIYATPREVELSKELVEDRMRLFELEMKWGNSAKNDRNYKFYEQRIASNQKELDGITKIRQEEEARQRASQRAGEAASYFEGELNNRLDENQELARKILKYREMGKALGWDDVKIQQTINDMIAARAKNTSGSGKQDPMINWLDTAADMLVKAKLEMQALVSGTNDLVEAEVKLAQLRNDKEFLAKSGKEQARVVEAYQAAAAEQKRLKAQKEADKEAIDQRETIAQYWRDQGKQWLDTKKRQDESVSKLSEENELLAFRLSILGLSSEEQKRQLGIQKARLELEKELAEIDKLDSSLDRESRKEQAYRIYAEKVKNINAEIALDAAQEYIKAFEDIKKGIADALTEALLNGGRAGKKKLRDMLVAELRKQITIQVNAYVNMGMDWLFGGGGSANQAFGTGGAMNNAWDKVSSLYSAYQSGGLSGMFGRGSSAGASTGEVSGMDMAADGKGGYGTLGASSAGAYANVVVAAVAAARQSYRDVKEGWNRDAAQGLKTDMDSSFGGKANPFSLGLRNAMELSRGLERMGFSRNTADFLTAMPAFTKLFGRKAGVIQQQGIEGTFSNGDLSANNFAQVYEKGGIFRRSKTTQVRGALSDANTQFLESSYESVRQSVAGMAEALGVGTEAIDNFTYSFRLDLQGLTEDEQVKKITEEFSKLSDAMVSNLFAVEEYRRIGESATETMLRISETLKLTNAMFKDLGWTVNQTSLAGYDAAESFANLFGGVSEMTQALSQYFNEYYTEQEKAQIRTEKLTQEFAKLGYVLPGSKEALRELIDQAEAMGNRELVAKLIMLSAEFTKSTEEQVAELEKYSDLQRRILELQGDTQALRELELATLDETGKALQRQIWALEDAKAAQEAYAKFVEDYTSRGKSLREFVQGERGGANNSYESLMIRARGGDLDAIDGIESAAMARIEQARRNATTLDQAESERQRILSEVLSLATELENFSGSEMEREVQMREAALSATSSNTSSLNALTTTLQVTNQLLNPSLNTSGSAAVMQGGSSEVTEELRKLNARLELVEANTKAAALSGNKTVRILERVTPDGESISVNVV